MRPSVVALLLPILALVKGHAIKEGFLNFYHHDDVNQLPLEIQELIPEATKYFNGNKRVTPKRTVVRLKLVG